MNILQEQFLSDKLKQLDLGDKIYPIYNIINEAYNILPSLNQLPDDLLLKIWNYLPDKDNIKLRFLLMSCCKRWKSLLNNNKKEIFISQNDIYKIFDSTIIKISANIESMVLKLDLKPRFFRSKWIYDFISKFPKLKKVTLVTWSIFKKNDIDRLVTISRLTYLEIIAGNNNLTMFLMDKKNKNSLYLDRIKIGCTSVMIPKENHPDMKILHTQKYIQNIDEWSWFRGEIYINAFLYNYQGNPNIIWLPKCSKVHIIDNYVNPYVSNDVNKLKSAVSYQNEDYFSDQGSFNMFELSKIMTNFPNLKSLKIKNFRKNEPIKIDNSWNLDRLVIHSKYRLHMYLILSLSIKFYQFISPEIIILKSPQDIEIEKYFRTQYIYKNKNLISLSIFLK